ncbi:MAG: 1-deoxy-D-xylulose-5-phosphate synthase [Segniliparus sp.]|uniref:1-deoxy-D-xylulose-5-phosphate synthase n=1 Tax=Segniliparus sp. TaxID=2804064 RepID=UPI003F2D4439
MLSSIASPSDLRALSPSQVTRLIGEIREFLIEKVCATGGHLGPNLGVVELTVALHRVFESPNDAIVFDTGHQSYVHKLLTGRAGGFDRLRKRGGLSGYPDRAESEHDWAESSHASAALSYADGLAKAFELGARATGGRGEGRSVVAVVGDGALTGGMCWEALNNIASSGRSVVVVVNDNGRSYSPTIGGLAERLTALRLQPEYEQILRGGREALRRVPLVGETAYRFIHAVKTGVKDAVSPQALFSDLGIKYLGPIDGHDEPALEEALRRAKRFGGPVIVHALTQKGKGFAPAEADEDEQMHAIGAIDPVAGRALVPAKPGWTSVFSQELVAQGERREELVAITAAMPGPTGLKAFGERFPDRMFDVGIAEQHAVTSAAGLALGGQHPVVAVYSTFLNRAFDQLLMDVALLKLPVTLVLDRAGVTGDDGASHNGMWDFSILSIVPGLRAAAPRDGARLREELGEALDTADGPTALRFPKGQVPSDVPAVRRLADGADVLDEDQAGRNDVLLVSVGAFAQLSLQIAKALREKGFGVTVVDPRWVLPLPESVLELAAEHAVVVTLEDSGERGGVGSTLSQTLRARDVDVPCRDIALPQRFYAHGTRAQVLEEAGITVDALVDKVSGWAEKYTGSRASTRAS